MNKSRQIGTFMAASVAALGMATVGLASPAAAAGPGPRPVTSWLRAVQAGTSSWVTIGWRTDRRICDVRVMVDGGRRVDVDYPGNRRFTSFSRDNSLRAGEVDYTAIRVTPDYDRAGVAVLRATIKYDRCGWHARPEFRSSYVTLPIVRRGWRPGPSIPGHDGPGHGWPGNGDHGDHGQGNGDHGQGNGDHGNGGPGNGGPGNGGPGNGGPGNGGPGHGMPTTAPTTSAPTTAPTANAPTNAPTTAPTSTAPTRPGNGGPGNGGNGNGGHSFPPHSPAATL